MIGGEMIPVTILRQLRHLREVWSNAIEVTKTEPTVKTPLIELYDLYHAGKLEKIVI